jgi:hypothetical protein
MTEERLIDKPWFRAMAGIVAGAAIGEYANKLYDECTSQQKQAWKDNRIMHHGEFGALTTVAGAGIESPIWAGFGLGLMISDLKDKEEWFRPRLNKK